METVTFESLVSMLGAPGAILFLMWWHSRGADKPRDAGAELIAKVDKLTEATDKISHRLTRVEVILEERK